MKRSFYEILGVGRDADQAQIDAAYALATERSSGAIRLGVAGAAIDARLLHDGYRMLSDPEKRARYDEILAAEDIDGESVVVAKNDGRRLSRNTTLLLAAVAILFCGLVYSQISRKMSEVQADYQQQVMRKQAEQNAPRVIEEVPIAKTATSTERLDIATPKVSDMAAGETILRLAEPAKPDSVSKTGNGNQASP